MLQTTTIANYQLQFEILSNQSIVVSELSTESSFKSIFRLGIRKVVCLHCSTSLDEATELTKLIEDKLNDNAYTGYSVHPPHPRQSCHTLIHLQFLHGTQHALVFELDEHPTCTSAFNCNA